VRKMGERVLHRMLPILCDTMASPDSGTRQGVCTGLKEVSCSRRQPDGWVGGWGHAVGRLALSENSICVACIADISYVHYRICVGVQLCAITRISALPRVLLSVHGLFETHSRLC
jgi:hypothetical protein